MNKNTFAVFMCRPILNEEYQIEDLEIYWQSSKIETIQEINVLRPGACLSILNDPETKIQPSFFQKLEKEAVSTCSITIHNHIVVLQAVETNENYLVTIRGNQPFDISQKGDLTVALHDAVFEYGGLGITVTDLNGVIKSVNPVLEQITGYTSEEVVNKKTLGDLKDPETYQKLLTEGCISYCR